MLAASFEDVGTLEESMADKGDCAGMEFDPLRPEEAGR
jgi:hypothetical protein